MVVSVSVVEQDRSMRGGHGAVEPRCQLDLITLEAGEVLFTPGTEKQFLYWINSGRIELRWPSGSSKREEVEILEAGSYFDLGFLTYHVCGAIALDSASIERLPRALAPRLAEIDPDLKSRDAIETQREFLHRRETVISSASQALTQRLAAFLSAVAQFNAYEGRHSLIISDDLTGPVSVVADYLGTDVDALGSALKQLSDLGAIECLPSRELQICDLDFLEYIANGEEGMPSGAAKDESEPPMLPRLA